jgi:hypothetical protein
MKSLPASATFGLTPVPPPVDAHAGQRETAWHNDDMRHGIDGKRRGKLVYCALLVLFALLASLGAAPMSAHHDQAAPSLR